MNDFILKDSGERREFDTGSRRDVDHDKPRPDLISPFALIRVGAHLAKGALKYGLRNWEKGQPVTVLLASTFRHLTQYMIGQRDEDHLSAAIFGLQAIIHFEERAKLGDQTALAMLDDYASKDLADELRREQEVAYIIEDAENVSALKDSLHADAAAVLALNGGAESIRIATVKAARANEDEWLGWAADGESARLNPAALLRGPTDQELARSMRRLRNDFLDIP